MIEFIYINIALEMIQPTNGDILYSSEGQVMKWQQTCPDVTNTSYYMDIQQFILLNDGRVLHVTNHSRLMIDNKSVNGFNKTVIESIHLLLDDTILVRHSFGRVTIISNDLKQVTSIKHVDSVVYLKDGCVLIPNSHIQWKLHNMKVRSCKEWATYQLFNDKIILMERCREELILLSLDGLVKEVILNIRWVASTLKLYDGRLALIRCHDNDYYLEIRSHDNTWSKQWIETRESYFSGRANLLTLQQLSDGRLVTYGANVTIISLKGQIEFILPFINHRDVIQLSDGNLCLRDNESIRTVKTPHLPHKYKRRIDRLSDVTVTCI